MAKVGRPRKLDDAKKKIILRALEIGLSRTVAAKLVGCDRQTIRDEAKRDEDFSVGVEAADAKGQFALIGKLHSLALAGNDRAIGWLAERRWPEKWGPPPKRVIEQKAEKLDLNVREDMG